MRKLKLRLSAADRERRDKWLSQFRENAQGELVRKDSRLVILAERERMTGLARVCRVFNLSLDVVNTAVEMNMTPDALRAWAAKRR
jgi:hypothetical protein